MNLEHIQLFAGSISSLIFAAGTMQMLIKAWRTKDMRSYSLSSLLLMNGGNLVHWLYILMLPFGPIWLLHTFYTITSGLMLLGYFVYNRRAAPAEKRATLEVRALGHILQTQEIARA